MKRRRSRDESTERISSDTWRIPYVMTASNAALIEREGPPGIKILAAYLTISSVPAIISWVAGRQSGAFAALHVVASVVVWVLAIRRQKTGVVADWLPLVAIPFLY